MFGQEITLDENAWEDPHLAPFVPSERETVTGGTSEGAPRSLEQIAQEMCLRDRIPESQWHLYMGEALQALAQGNRLIYELPEAPNPGPIPHVEFKPEK